MRSRIEVGGGGAVALSVKCCASSVGILYYFNQFAIGQKLTFLHFRKISENLKNQEKITGFPENLENMGDTKYGNGTFCIIKCELR